MHAQIARRSKPSQRHGFTLLELLIAISIVALLASLLLVAVQGAQGAANTAAVVNEIKEMEAALEAFKKEYGVYPPSVFVIDENPEDGGSDIAALGAGVETAASESAQFMQRFSPLSLAAYEAFTDAAGATTAAEQTDGTSGFDVNGDGDATDVVILNGAECLVFFLGGMAVSDSGGTRVLNGFSRNPAAIFDTSTAGDRVKFLDLDPSRLVDTDGDGMFEYAAPIGDETTPYQYFRATAFKTYRPEGPDTRWGTDDDERLSDGLSLAYYQALSLGEITDAISSTVVSGSNVPVNTATSKSKPWNDSSFQIICAGPDGQFGVGGTVGTGDSQRLEPLASISVNVAGSASALPRDNTAITLESDNITNFTQGAIGR